MMLEQRRGDVKSVSEIAYYKNSDWWVVLSAHLIYIHIFFPFEIFDHEFKRENSTVVGLFFL